MSVTLSGGFWVRITVCAASILRVAAFGTVLPLSMLMMSRKGLTIELKGCVQSVGSTLELAASHLLLVDEEHAAKVGLEASFLECFFKSEIDVLAFSALMVTSFCENVSGDLPKLEVEATADMLMLIWLSCASSLPFESDGDESTESIVISLSQVVLSLPHDLPVPLNWMAECACCPRFVGFTNTGSDPFED